MMLRIYQPEEAKETILKRRPMDDYEIPESMKQNMLKFFGENLTPGQAISSEISAQFYRLNINFPVGWI